MMTVKEIKRLKWQAQYRKSRAFTRGDDFNYRLNCKVEKILNAILGDDVDGRVKQRKNK